MNAGTQQIEENLDKAPRGAMLRILCRGTGAGMGPVGASPSWDSFRLNENISQNDACPGARD